MNVPGLGILPFWYWLIAIFVIAVVHEFSHGIVARAHNIPVKHTGLAFFGPIIGAFVEPDEKKLRAGKDITQYSVYAAGAFSNVILALLALLLLAYPRRAWRDAPVFPTPRGALSELAKHVKLPPGARVVDAGCGMGDGLIELPRALPEARLEGVEWSTLWRAVSAWRCPWATVRRGDMWADDWSAFELVYLFQRPETMPRAMDKARREMRPGSWLVSLEFEARDADGLAWTPVARWELGGERPVWVYRIPRG